MYRASSPGPAPASSFTGSARSLVFLPRGRLLGSGATSPSTSAPDPGWGRQLRGRGERAVGAFRVTRVGPGPRKPRSSRTPSGRSRGSTPAAAGSSARLSPSTGCSAAAGGSDGNRGTPAPAPAEEAGGRRGAGGWSRGSPGGRSRPLRPRPLQPAAGRVQVRPRAHGAAPPAPKPPARPGAPAGRRAAPRGHPARGHPATRRATTWEKSFQVRPRGLSESPSGAEARPRAPAPLSVARGRVPLPGSPSRVPSPKSLGAAPIGPGHTLWEPPARAAPRPRRRWLEGSRDKSPEAAAGARRGPGTGGRTRPRGSRPGRLRGPPRPRAPSPRGRSRPHASGPSTRPRPRPRRSPLPSAPSAQARPPQRACPGLASAASPQPFAFYTLYNWGGGGGGGSPAGHVIQPAGAAGAGARAERGAGRAGARARARACGRAGAGLG